MMREYALAPATIIFGLCSCARRAEFLVIDGLGFLAHAVGNKFVHFPGKIQRVAVRQVSAMREVHAEHCVARLQHGHVNGNVGLRAGVRLHVGVFRAKKRFRAINRQLLGTIDKFAAAVVALAGITFRIFIREHRAHGFDHGFGDKIFGGDQFKAGALTAAFFAQHFGDVRIDFLQGAIHVLGCFCVHFVSASKIGFLKSQIT